MRASASTDRTMAGPSAMTSALCHQLHLASAHAKVAGTTYTILYSSAHRQHAGRDTTPVSAALGARPAEPASRQLLSQQVRGKDSHSLLRRVGRQARPWLSAVLRGEHCHRPCTWIRIWDTRVVCSSLCCVQHQASAGQLVEHMRHSLCNSHHISCCIQRAANPTSKEGSVRALNLLSTTTPFLSMALTTRITCKKALLRIVHPAVH